MVNSNSGDLKAMEYFTFLPVVFTTGNCNTMLLMVLAIQLTQTYLVTMDSGDFIKNTELVLNFKLILQD